MRSLDHPFWVRHGTSDAYELIHTVFRQTYGQWLPRSSPRWILDLGANIGDTAAWFLSRFPSARVVAVEPDPDNCKMARRNLQPYGGRAILVQAAAWSSDGMLTLQTGDHAAGSLVRPPAPGETATCTAVSIPALLHRYEIPEIDILKCDIEGAEEPLFREDPEPWLSRTRHVCIELHSPAANAVVHTAAARNGFSVRVYRDVFVFSKG